MPCLTVPRSLEKWLSEWHGRGMARRGMPCVNKTRPYCVNQMGNTQYEPFKGAAWQGNGMDTSMGTAWYV
jgi:hypothetical protein